MQGDATTGQVPGAQPGDVAPCAPAVVPACARGESFFCHVRPGTRDRRNVGVSSGSVEGWLDGRARPLQRPPPQAAGVRLAADVSEHVEPVNEVTDSWRQRRCRRQPRP